MLDVPLWDEWGLLFIVPTMVLFIWTCLSCANETRMVFSKFLYLLVLRINTFEYQDEVLFHFFLLFCLSCLILTFIAWITLTIGGSTRKEVVYSYYLKFTCIIPSENWLWGIHRFFPIVCT